MAPPHDLFTIGYQGLVQSQLIDVLAANGVGTVLDVRAVPQSRKAGFSKSLLCASLRAVGIGYLNDCRLGTPKPGRDAARSGKTAAMIAIFTEHMRSPPAQDGLTAAIALSAARPTCLLCFEQAPHDCHRSLVAQMIRDRTGQTIRHL